MAAGIGSRYGGLKQIEPVDGAGRVLIDYSLYDAVRAGFDRAVFIIRPDMERDFHEYIGKYFTGHMSVSYAPQTMDALPPGFGVPEGRIKPWGTAHAVLCARHLVDADFAVINADDFYGASAFQSVYDFLINEADSGHHAMIGYTIGNTLTENGYVARGVCKTDGGRLMEITERTHIETRPGGAAYTEDGANYSFIPDDTTVSMNFWAFGQSVMNEIDNRFPAFLSENLPKAPLKCEYFLPLIPNMLLREGKAEIRVLHTPDKWYGVTYAADIPVVRRALERMRYEGKYPEFFWGNKR